MTNSLETFNIIAEAMALVLVLAIEEEALLNNEGLPYVYRYDF